MTHSHQGFGRDFAAGILVFGGVALWRHRRSRSASGRTDELAVASAMSHAGGDGAPDVELSDAVSRLVTLVRWLRRDMDTAAAQDVMRQRVERLASQAERIEAVVRGTANRRPRGPHASHDRAMRPNTSASHRRFDRPQPAMIASRS